MKISLLTIVSLLTITAELQATPPVYMPAKVSGTVATQIILGPTDGRIGSSKVDNNRIFTEFGVSSTDYALVFGTTDVGLFLVPKHTAAVLPTLTVLTFDGSSQTAIDTKSRTFMYEAGVDTNSAVNVFQNLAGTVVGTLKYSGAFPPSTFSSASFTMIGHGTDQSGGGSGSAILQLKITAKGTFTQVP